ncbi:MAG: arginyltransferase [Pseudomonadota bacterium]
MSASNAGDTPPLEDIRFYATAYHACSYLPERSARSVFVDPHLPKSQPLYSRLATLGFRRSGDEIYIPHCEECRACIPVRVDARHFAPRRIHRRILRRNADVEQRIVPARYDETHFDLYRRYQQAKHPGGSMSDHTAQDYREFLLSHWAGTQLLELRAAGQLLAVSVLDPLNDGWSCVYTFFDVEASHRSPGVLAVLLAIEHTRQHGLPWVYLGYWIDGCQKMSYKAQYIPQQRLREGRWHDLSRSSR